MPSVHFNRGWGYGQFPATSDWPHRIVGKEKQVIDLDEVHPGYLEDKSDKRML